MVKVIGKNPRTYEDYVMTLILTLITINQYIFRVPCDDRPYVENWVTFIFAPFTK